jgi:hypothetical protein
MPIGDVLRNLGAGLSEAADNPEAAARFREPGERRKALSDFELELQTKQILGDVSALQQRRASLDPKSPTYQKDLQTIDQALHDSRGVFTDLYHPQNNPGALDKLGGYITRHLHLSKQPQGEAVTLTPFQVRRNLDTRLASINSAAYAPGSGEENPYSKKARQIREAFPTLNNDEVEQAVGVVKPEKPEAENWQTHDITLADGTQMSAQYNTKSGGWRDLAGGEIPKEKLAGAKVNPKAGAAGSKPVRAWKKDAKGKIYSVLLDPQTNQMKPGSENYDILPPAAMGGKITTGFYHWVDDKGAVHQQRETHISTPLSAGGASPDSESAVPKTPGEAKKRAAAAAGKSTDKAANSGDTVLGHKDTPVQSAARKKWVDAVSLDTIATEVEKHPNDAVNQKRLAVALERQAAGRFTTQALDYIVKAGWGNTIEGWANSTTTGALPADVMRQLIDGAHENLTGAKAGLDAALLGASPEQDPQIKEIMDLLNQTDPKKKNP